MNGKHETRVLGRVLAVEETTHVSGAKPTLPLYDNITSLRYDTSPNSEYGIRTVATPEIPTGNDTIALPTHASGT